MSAPLTPSLRAQHKCDCGHERSYSWAFDAFYCKAEDKWLNCLCGDPLCHFCKGRKAKPSEHNLCEPVKK